MSAALRISVPTPSFVPQKVIEQLEYAADERQIESSVDTYLARSTRYDPIRISGESDTIDALKDVLSALQLWTGSLSGSALILLSFRVDSPLLLIESVAPVAGKTACRSQVKDAQDVLVLLDQCQVLPHVTRILLGPDRSSIVADIGKRAAYLIDLNTKAVTVAPSAGDVPAPKS
jgi:hypothetical protein